MGRQLSPPCSRSSANRGLCSTRRTHTRGRDAPLADYAGFGMPVLAPADGRVVEVTDHYADNPPGTNSDDANYLVIAIDVDRYVSMAHLQQGSVTVAVGDSVHLVSSSPRLGTTATPAHRICTSRSKTLPQVATPTALTPCCSATSTSPGAVPGRGATQAISAPATSSDHADRRVDPGWGLQARLGRTSEIWEPSPVPVPGSQTSTPPHGRRPQRDRLTHSRG